MRKKMFSLLLCLAMLTGILTVSALAENSAEGYPIPENLCWDEDSPGYCEWDFGDLTQLGDETVRFKVQVYRKTASGWEAMEDCYENSAELTDEELQRWKHWSLYVGDMLAAESSMTNPFAAGEGPVGLHLESGEYYFTVEYYFGSGAKTSAQSPVWSYVQPSAKLETPSGLTWQGTRLCWSAPTAGTEWIACYNVTWEDPVNERWYFYPVDAGETSFDLAEYMSEEELARGGYYFRVMAMSQDMTVIQDSDWSATSPVYLSSAPALSIRYASKTIDVGKTFQFTATGGSGKYTWRTGNTSVATVDSTGKVTGKAAGNTYLYCRDTAGSEVKCLLKITGAPLSIRYSSKTIDVGKPFQFTATGGSGSYTWRVGNTSVAAVDSTGKVTGKAAGNTYLYCKDSAGAEVKCLLKVIAPLSIRYSEKTVSVGASFQFTATGGSGTYTWRVGNTSVATVDSTGKVTGKAAGNTYLYCKDSAGAEVKCLLKVIAPLSIRYSEKTVSVGASFQFTATGGSGSYTWRTGNTSVATVDSSGKVTGKTAGNTYLYCRDSYGNEVKCLLKIKG